MKEKICIYSACDRFNYGDLLFPIVLTNLLKPLFGDRYDIEIFGTIKSNLSSFGAMKTKPIRRIFSPNYLVDGSALIIGGGEVLPADWVRIHSDLDCRTLLIANIMKKRGKKFSLSYPELYNFMSRYMLCPNIRYPFLLGNSDFKPDVKVIYNTIGCSAMKRLSIKDRQYFKKKLSETQYFSVRDKSSLKVFKELGFQDAKIKLAPDSAIMISEIFAKQKILDLALSATRDFIQKNSNRYICFQVCEKQAGKNHFLIAEQLQQISRKYNMPILLLPIGYARNHWDQKPLKRLKKECKVPTIIPSGASVFDIMASIAFSRIFIGTSLHGIITALSFGVPYLGLGPKGEKVDLFLKTWDIPEHPESVPVTGFAQKISSMMAISSEEISSKRDKMVQQYHQCFKDIVDTIKNKEK